MDEIKKTKEAYSFLWKRNGNASGADEWHFNAMQRSVSEPIARGEKGIDVGSGCGYDTYIMAKDNPSIKIYSMDISDGIFKTRNLTLGFNNVFLVKGSVLDIPLKNDVFDFAYSYGVLHHIPDSRQGLREISRILKRGAPLFLYLYEDHSESHIKYYALKLVAFLRKFSTRVPHRILYIISYLASPIAVIVFSLPARILSNFTLTRHLSENMPFNFGTHPFSLAGDLYDRFGAAIERRFSRKEVFELLSAGGFRDIEINRIDSRAGWVAWGCKG